MLTYAAKAVFMERTELEIAREVMEHYKRTDYEALYVNELIILRILGFCPGYSLAFCLRTLRIANWRMSPISSNA